MIDNCGCDNWAVSMAKNIFETNHIPCKGAYIVDMNYKWININAEICTNASSGEEAEWEIKHYVIKYWEERKFLCTSLFSYWFYEREEYERVGATGNVYSDTRPKDIEEGNYIVIKMPGFGICKKVK